MGFKSGTRFPLGDTQGSPTSKLGFAAWRDLAVGQHVPLPGEEWAPKVAQRKRTAETLPKSKLEHGANFVQDSPGSGAPVPFQSLQPDPLGKLRAPPGRDPPKQAPRKQPGLQGYKYLPRACAGRLTSGFSPPTPPSPAHCACALPTGHKTRKGGVLWSRKEQVCGGHPVSYLIVLHGSVARWLLLLLLLLLLPLPFCAQHSTRAFTRRRPSHKTNCGSVSVPPLPAPRALPANQRGKCSPSTLPLRAVLRAD